MINRKSFKGFAPKILKSYYRDKEAFWKAIFTPFLSNKVSFASWVKTIGVDIDLISAFSGLDKDAFRLLKEYSSQFILDITKWESNRLQYFKDAYPVFAFLAIWMDENGLTDYILKFDEILEAGVYAVAGYGILDDNVDGQNPSPVQILVSQALLGEYEKLALNVFGVTKTNLEIINKMKMLYLTAEIKEKEARNKYSPYQLDHPEGLGAKGANAVTPFMLCLERSGKASNIDDYWQVFLLFGAVIQMIDDWMDLESDLAIGHYSYLTLRKSNLSNINNPAILADQMKKDKELVQFTYDQCKKMIKESNQILDRLNETLLVKMVDITELRLENFYRKELNL
jgi:hypothetical protein